MLRYFRFIGVPFLIKMVFRSLGNLVFIGIFIGRWTAVIQKSASSIFT